jgi:hypothetical protein
MRDHPRFPVVGKRQGAASGNVALRQTNAIAIAAWALSAILVSELFGYPLQGVLLWGLHLAAIYEHEQACLC